jgi:hypothetical protein
VIKSDSAYRRSLYDWPISLYLIYSIYYYICWVITLRDNNLLLITLLVNAAAFTIKELLYFPYPLSLRPRARPTINTKAAYAILNLLYLFY